MCGPRWPPPPWHRALQSQLPYRSGPGGASSQDTENRPEQHIAMIDNLSPHRPRRETAGIAGHAGCHHRRRRDRCRGACAGRRRHRGLPLRRGRQGNRPVPAAGPDRTGVPWPYRRRRCQARAMGCAPTVRGTRPTDTASIRPSCCWIHGRPRSTGHSACIRCCSIATVPRPDDTAALMPKAIVGAPPVAAGRPTAPPSTGTARSSTNCMSAASP